jgi:hypothetical protein
LAPCQLIIFYDLLSQVIENCKIVANATHKRYGIFAIAIHFMCFLIENINQIMVININEITIEASELLFKPNCTVVKEKLKIRFNANGIAVFMGSSFLYVL